jgi:hypothetical protein
MPRVTFLTDFDFRPNGRSIVAYKAGWSGPVKAACAEQALAAGAITSRFNGAPEAAFDHDDDAKAGGSKPRRGRRPRAPRPAT